jgi:hypothetical protein
MFSVQRWLFDVFRIGPGVLLRVDWAVKPCAFVGAPSQAFNVTGQAMLKSKQPVLHQYITPISIQMESRRVKPLFESSQGLVFAHHSITPLLHSSSTSATPFHPHRK